MKSGPPRRSGWAACIRSRCDLAPARKPTRYRVVVLPSQAEYSVTPKFFTTPSAFRKWLAKHHSTAKELSVGFYKKHTGKPSITWPESVDEALCFGWIDGVRNRIDEDSYRIRFNPVDPPASGARSTLTS